MYCLCCASLVCFTLGRGLLGLKFKNFICPFLSFTLYCVLWYLWSWVLFQFSFSVDWPDLSMQISIAHIKASPLSWFCRVLAWSFSPFILKNIAPWFVWTLSHTSLIAYCWRHIIVVTLIILIAGCWYYLCCFATVLVNRTAYFCYGSFSFNYFVGLYVTWLFFWC